MPDFTWGVAGADPRILTLQNHFAVSQGPREMGVPEPPQHYDR